MPRYFTEKMIEKKSLCHLGEGGNLSYSYDLRMG